MIAKPVQLLHNFAELHKRLGEIPLERIRMNPLPGSATKADWETAKGSICELIDGVLVEKAMGDRESFLSSYLIYKIGSVVMSQKLGAILGEAGFIRINDDLIRAPDVTFIPWSSFPGKKLPPEAWWSVTPGLIVEVLSPSNTKAEIDRKLREFFGLGCKLAWVIDPKTQTAKVYTSLTRVKHLDANGVLDGGKVLPGFKLSLTELFESTEPPEDESR